MTNLEDFTFNLIDQKLFESRMIQISGGVNSKLAHHVNKTLHAMASVDSKTPIVLLVNSPGGEITSGFSIYDTARFIGPKIYTLVVGLAASMGSIISLAAAKENRLALPNAKFLIHQPLISGVIQGSASELEIHAKDIVKTREKINKLYAQETGKSVDEIQKLTDRDHWLNAQEAKELGLISRIVESKADLKL